MSCPDFLKNFITPDKIANQKILLLALGFLTILSINLFSPLSVKSIAADSFDDQVIVLINSERAKNDLTSLKKSDKLTQASSLHNKVMNDCYQQFNLSTCFAHQVTKLNEEKLIDRISDTGYNPQSVAENIARGFKTPSAVVTAWMNSSGHRSAILNTTRPDIGCDFLDGASGNSSRFFWTCDFGKSFSASDAYSLPNGAPTDAPTDKITSTPTPTPIQSGPTKTLTPTLAPIFTPTPSISKPWFCKYVPTHRYCQ